MSRLSCAHFFSLAFSVLLVSCGGGGSSGDSTPGDTVSERNISGPNRFLLFPNPQVLSDGSFETNKKAYASAYYAAVDSGNERDTLEKWKAKNGFPAFGQPNQCDGDLGLVNVTFGDVRDLGYGREMYACHKANGSMAFYVRNYLVTAGSGYGYSSLNLDAAVAQDLRWHIGTNAIEYSPSTNPDGDTSVKFAKFYNFDSETGARRLTANLDGRGDKAMPGICISCHGGRADPLTPVGSFAKIANSRSQQRGDTLAKLQLFDVNAFEFSAKSGHRRADLEAKLKRINRMILCTYPVANIALANQDTACTRPVADPHEWQGNAADVITAAYGGATLPNPTFSKTIYVPSGWSSIGGRDQLYKDVAEPYCMTCHRVRGTGNQSDISFVDYAQFAGYSDRIKAHVYDRGNMPLAKIVSDSFWASLMPERLASWLESINSTYALFEKGSVVQPGRPIADPGPDRLVKGSIILSGSNSLYADSYRWSITENANNASLLNANTATPTFVPSADGMYKVQLVVSKNGKQSAPATISINVNSGLAYDPADPASLRFVTDIKPILKGACVTCHVPSGSGLLKPPIFYADDDGISDLDRNGDTAVNAVDDTWFYKEVRGRVNFTDVVASPLLRKPAGNHHGGALVTGFDTSLAVGSAGRADYDKFVNWIMNGAPE